MAKAQKQTAPRRGRGKMTLTVHSAECTGVRRHLATGLQRARLRLSLEVLGPDGRRWRCQGAYVHLAVYSVTDLGTGVCNRTDKVGAKAGKKKRAARKGSAAARR